MKRTLSIEVISPHFIFRRAKVLCTPTAWEEHTRSGEAIEQLPAASLLTDNHAEVELRNDCDYWISMADLVIETAARDKTFQIPFYFHHPKFSINDDTAAAGLLTISIDAAAVYAVSLLDRTGRPVASGTLRLALPDVPITFSPQLGEGGSILFLGNPTVYFFDLSNESGLKIVPV